MRFLLDVHIATSIGRAIVDRNHDVIRASDRHATWIDERLLDLAVRDRRVLVTEDRDFSDLIYRDGAPPPPAILYLRCGPAQQREIVDRVLMVIENTLIDGHMVVIQQNGVRHRPLPEKSIHNG